MLIANRATRVSTRDTGATQVDVSRQRDHSKHGSTQSSGKSIPGCIRKLEHSNRYVRERRIASAAGLYANIKGMMVVFIMQMKAERFQIKFTSRFFHCLSPYLRVLYLSVCHRRLSTVYSSITMGMAFLYESVLSATACVLNLRRRHWRFV